MAGNYRSANHETTIEKETYNSGDTRTSGVYHWCLGQCTDLQKSAEDALTNLLIISVAGPPSHVSITIIVRYVPQTKIPHNEQGGERNDTDYIKTRDNSNQKDVNT